MVRRKILSDGGEGAKVAWRNGKDAGCTVLGAATVLSDALSVGTPHQLLAIAMWVPCTPSDNFHPLAVGINLTGVNVVERYQSISNLAPLAHELHSR